MHIEAIIMAAGLSKRFGKHDKLLYPFKNRPLIAHVLAAFNDAEFTPSVTVSSENEPLLCYLKGKDCQIVEIDQAHLGMGYGLKMALDFSNNADAWLISPADLPFLDSKTINKVKTHLHQGASVCYPMFENHQTHPVGFSRKFLPALLKIDNAHGARKILEAHKAQATTFSLSNHMTAYDIDTLNQLRAVE